MSTTTTTPTEVVKMAPPKSEPTMLDYLDADQVWRACRYWSEGDAEIVSFGRPPTNIVGDVDAKLLRVGWSVRLRMSPGGILTLNRRTAERGIKRLVAQVAALDNRERWIETKYGRGVTLISPAGALDSYMTHGDDNAVDVVMQYGAFGCLIFG